MSERSKSPPPTREERLAAQLRANLRRRKAQAREMTGQAAANNGGSDESLTESKPAPGSGN
ncbi:hypothetical protein [Croceicoccus mobilis]|uniref:hypothetical protein n=1 Tax=Croceicoccus mobilis TaxID=1703339 RepID=UPI00082AABA5|nr:hypothetical protein [Croceicoccus mobilis]